MGKRNGEQANNHEVVFTTLQGSRKPMTAYDLLGRLRPKGITAPTTIYRALDRLIDDGRVHRLESLNAFVSCGHPGHDATAVFSICGDCGDAKEIVDPKLQQTIMAVAKSTGFTLAHAVVEMRGRCKACTGTARAKNLHD